MIFTLEALQAKHGDALLLHYGRPSQPRLIVIDGGPAGCYQGYLRPRLSEIKHEYGGDGPLQIEMLLVSHADDDHINGMLALSNEMLYMRDSGSELPYQIGELWHNSFDDIMAGEGEELVSSLNAAVKPLTAGGSLPANLALSRQAAALMASVPQQRELRDNARKLAIGVNLPWSGPVVAPSKGKKTVNLKDGLKLNVIGPNTKRLVDLNREWDMKKKLLAKDAKGQSMAAAFIDVSVFDLSSIVILAEFGGKQMLLTGDARGDDIIMGLQGAGFLKRGRLHVDVFKLPRHGSDRNVDADLFRQVTADHYVVSADGKYGNPAIATLQMISEAREQDEFTIQFTNRERRLEEFFKRERENGKHYHVVFRDDKKPSIRINLGEEIV